MPVLLDFDLAGVDDAAVATSLEADSAENLKPDPCGCDDRRNPLTKELRLSAKERHTRPDHVLLGRAHPAAVEYPHDGLTDFFDPERRGRYQYG